MASLYADVGKQSEDLLTKVFPGDDTKSSNFETEINAKTNNGNKIQLVVSRKDEEGIVANLKPSYPLNIAQTKGELKFQLSSLAGKSKVDASFDLNSLSGLKVKVGADEKTLNGGFEYVAPKFSSAVKVNYDLTAKKSHSLETSGVLVGESHAIGGKLVHKSDEPPAAEAKFHCFSSDANVVFKVGRTVGGYTYGLNYFQQLNQSRSLAAQVTFGLGGSKNFLNNVNVILATSNQVCESTLLKSRFNTETQNLGFGIVHKLGSNLNVEVGTQFPASLAPTPTYNVKLVYN